MTTRRRPTERPGSGVRGAERATFLAEMNEVPWIDQVLAVPAMGVYTLPWLGFAPGIWAALEKLGPTWRKEKEQVSVQANGPTTLRVVRDSGLYFDLTPDNIVSGFTYRLAVKDRPGRLPELVNAFDAIQTYTQTLDEVAGALTELLGAIAMPTGRSVHRIGCLADCRMAEDAAPPGVTGFVNHLDSAWPGKVKAIESNLLVELSASDQSRDQCHHTLSKNAYDKPNDLRLRLDWQRYWVSPKTMGSAELKAAVDEVKKMAVEYFSAFGEGRQE